jgi:hypothetical protein
MGEQSAGTFTALCAVGVVTFALVAACTLPLRTELYDAEDASLPQLPWLPKHAGIQAVSLAWTLISAAQCVLMIPDAYGLPWHGMYMTDALQGRGVLMTSLLLILFSAEGARRLMRPWSQTQNRTVVLSIIAGQFAMALLFGAAADASDPWRLGESFQQTVLVISRLGCGICFGFANVLLAMAVKVTASESLMQFTVWRSGAMCLGAGIGALVSANSEAPASLLTQTLLWVCIPWILLGFAAALLLPEDLAPLLTKLAASEDSHEALRASQKVQTDDEANAVASRKKIWLLALMAIFSRGLLTTAFEFTSATIFASEFLFSGPQVFLAVGSSLLCGAFVMPLLVLVKLARPSLDVGNICVAAACSTVFATMLLVRLLSEHAAPGSDGMWLLFSVNAVSLPAVNLVGGIMEAFALQQSLALQQVLGDSAVSQENLIVICFVLQDCVSRFAVPSIILSLLSCGGQALCAVALLLVATLACVATFCTRGTLESIKSSRTETLSGKAAVVSSGESVETAA